MEFIRESAEHHFLTTLDSLKRNPENWMTLHFALSKKIDHKDIIDVPENIKDKIKKHHSTSKTLAKNLMATLECLEEGFLYHFSDNDLVLLAQAQDEKDRKIIHGIYENMTEVLRQSCSDVGLLSKNFYAYQKMADDKLLSCKRLDAYNAMANEVKISSIPVRRTRRENPVVMVVEDDRFTASYTSSLLNQDYDVVVCRNGEDAIQSYIEEAPDLVFLDIHLPGLSGHETLQAIRVVDPDPYVVMLSVDTAKNSIVKASKGGAQKFLKKPFSKDRLLNITKMSPYIYMRNMRMRSENITS